MHEINNPINLNNPPIKKKARIAAKILMIVFQLVGCLALLIYGFVAIERLHYADDQSIPVFAFIQLLAVIISFLGWIPFKRSYFAIAVLISFFSVLSMVLILVVFANSLSYN